MNDAPLQCGTVCDGIGRAHSQIELSDFRVYVHDLQLIDDAGRATPVELDEDSAFQLRYEKEDGGQGGLALLDFATRESDVCSYRGTLKTNTVIHGRAPEAAYTRIAFTVGVPPELNHVNGAESPAPLNSYGMQWSWASGYRHMKVEVRAITGDKVKERYHFHPGAAGCRSDNGALSGEYVCENPLDSRIELPFTPGRQDIAADLARLFASSDLSTGRGCMGASTLSDPEVDGDDIKPATGCAEVWDAVGSRVGKVFASRPETLGHCGDSSSTCKSNADCSQREPCIGYAPAVAAERAMSTRQTMFTAIMHDETIAPHGERPDVAMLADDEPFGWPCPGYDRDPSLDVPSISFRNGLDSHARDDARYGVNCVTCHQALGPGKSRCIISGTVVDDEGGTYTGGGFVQLGTGIGNRNGPTVHPVADKIRDFRVLFELPLDANGQFYATADQASELDYAQRGYFARLVGRRGTCKTATGEVVPDAEGHGVTCDADADCASLRYSRSGECMSAAGEAIMENALPRRCGHADDCRQQGATCQGAKKDAAASRPSAAA